MENVILVVHIIACIALIGVVLMQRSEGGALGMGGGGGGGLMSGRGAASALTRTTMILGAVFFATSLILTTIATRTNGGQTSLIDSIEQQELDELNNAPSDLDAAPSGDLYNLGPAPDSDLDEAPVETVTPSDLEEPEAPADEQPTE